MKEKIWNLANRVNLSCLDKLTLSHNIKEVLFRRGYCTEEEVNQFISPCLVEKAYDHFPFLDKAAKRIINAIDS